MFTRIDVDNFKEEWAIREHTSVYQDYHVRVMKKYHNEKILTRINDKRWTTTRTTRTTLPPLELVVACPIMTVDVSTNHIHIFTSKPLSQYSFLVMLDLLAL
jgi:hypothetical protein